MPRYRRLPSDLLLRRPDNPQPSRADRCETRASAGKGAILPSISLTAFSVRQQGTGDLFTGRQGNGTWPGPRRTHFHGSRIKGDVKAARRSSNRRCSDMKRRSRAASRVRDALIDQDRTRVQWTRRRSRSRPSRSMRACEPPLRERIHSYIEVLDAERSFFNDSSHTLSARAAPALRS